jgi:hypothetical protein
LIRYLLAWLPMVLIAVGNGVVREAFLTPRLGELHGRQLSTLLLVALFGGYVWLLTRLWPIASARQALAVGFAWLCLTLVFEFSLGYFASGLSWREMLSEYDLAAGRLWALVPPWVALAPYVFFRLQRQKARPEPG